MILNQHHRQKKQLEQCYPVVNSDKPTQADLKLDETLTNYMKDNIPLEIISELQRRELVLSKLKVIFADWVKMVCIRKGLSEELASEAGGQIYTSGSYRLGVHEPGADIDTICVAPQHCTRDDFFSSLKELLQKHPQVTNLSAIDSAAVPIMSFDFDTVNIDLLFAQLPLNTVTQTLDIDDDYILQGVDTATEKSLNGPRVTNLIVKLVPNFNNFLIVLRCVRHWAKRRGLYSNKLGYLGGVNWCILVALVCQLYPNASPSYLLLRFFRVFVQWQWPNPIHLCHPVVHNDLGLTVWDAQTYGNRFHMMPIITPAYPAMNSAVSVSRETLEVMKREFARGKDIMTHITQENGQNWEELFSPTEFFGVYDHYLALNIIANDDESFRPWSGYVESRLRKLLDYISLGRLPLSGLHLCPTKFKSCTIPLTAFRPSTSEPAAEDGEPKLEQFERKGICYFLAFELDMKRLDQKGSTVSIDGPVQSFKEYELGRFNKFVEGMEFVVSHYKWKQLPDFVFETLGGKAKAKELHKSRGKPKELVKPVVPVKTAVSLPAIVSQQDTDVQQPVKIEDDELTSQPAMIPEESDHQPIKAETATSEKRGLEQGLENADPAKRIKTAPDAAATLPATSPVLTQPHSDAQTALICTQETEEKQDKCLAEDEIEHMELKPEQIAQECEGSLLEEEIEVEEPVSEQLIRLNPVRHEWQKPIGKGIIAGVVFKLISK